MKIETDENGQYPDKNRIGRVKPITKTNVVKLAATGTNGAAKNDLDDEIDF